MWDTAGSFPTLDARMVTLSRQSLDAPLSFEAWVQRPHGHIDDMLSWCKQECADAWAWELKTLSSPRQQGEYVFYFADKQDCFAFTVKWT